MEETPRGDRQVVGGGVESPQGIDNPVVEEFPFGDETSGVLTEGEGVPGEDVQGGEGMETPPPPEQPRCADPAAATR